MKPVVQCSMRLHQNPCENLNVTATLTLICNLRFRAGSTGAGSCPSEGSSTGTGTGTSTGAGTSPVEGNLPMAPVPP